MKTQTLPVPGATLYYEIRGAGPTLLLICGGVYDAAGYAGLAEQLADRYTVVTYDRRGNSRSPLAGLDGPQEIEVHADDAHRLLAEVTDEPAYVFGNSSGAVIGLALAARHPGQVRALVAHEPPLFELLPDREHWRDVVRRIEETFHTAGAQAASAVLAAAFEAIEGGPEIGDRMPGGAEGPHGEPDPQTSAMMARLARNVEFFIGWEVPSFAPYTPDLAALTGVRVLTAVGEASHPDLPYVRAADVVAQRLGARTVTVPGDHGGFGSHAPAFAEALHRSLSGS